MIVEIVGTEVAGETPYHISVSEEIRRVLITRKGDIPMNPEYGSELWRYRDREMSGEVRLAVIAETFGAIEDHVSRVRPTHVEIVPSSDGVFGLRISVEEKI